MIIDIAIFVLIALVLFRGKQLGFVQQVFAGAGFIAGLLLGALLSPHIPVKNYGPQAKALFTIAVVFTLATILLFVFEYVGLWIKQKVQRREAFKMADHILGMVAAVAFFVVVLWLSSPLLLRSPIGTIR